MQFQNSNLKQTVILKTANPAETCVPAQTSFTYTKLLP